MENVVVRRWIKIAIFNLFLVAVIGTMLRYKIAFSLPFIDQKKLLHGHSHFAFSGWVSLAVMVLMVDYLSRELQRDFFASYKWLLGLQLFSAYAMMIAFPIQGYAFFSILFSTLSVFVSYFFTVKYRKDMKLLNTDAVTPYWFSSALLFNVFSSLGTFVLAYMMANKIAHQHWYLGAIYFYLHFQYNGWFFFGCMGLLNEKMEQAGVQRAALKRVWLLLTVACVPAYFLSVLWLKMSPYLYAGIVLTGLLQLYAWWKVIRILSGAAVRQQLRLPAVSQWLLLFSGMALSIKFALQAASTIPALGQWAFGFRPIIIAYLHLVLLGVITLFLVGYLLAYGYLRINNTAIAGVVIFVTGIAANELLLMIQGIASIDYNSIPHTNEWLLLAAIVMATGIFTLWIAQFSSKNN